MTPNTERKIARVRAARAAIDAAGAPVVLTARCEPWLIRDPDLIATIVKAVAPRPVNVLVSAPGPGLTLAHLADLGVRRISVGSALARVAWGAFLRAAQSLAGAARGAERAVRAALSSVAMALRAVPRSM